MDDDALKAWLLLYAGLYHIENHPRNENRKTPRELALQADVALQEYLKRRTQCRVG